jgi:hypothetical protein
MKLNDLLNKPTSSVSELAKKYKVSTDAVEKQLAKGIKVEMEHTSLKSVAREIALDHLGEDLHYYEKLAKIEQPAQLDEGRNTSVIVVDVQPEYSGILDGDENPVFEQIIRFVNNQTGPVLMFVNAEDQGMTGDTVQDVKLYWEDTIRGEDVDPETNPHPINWNRFQIVDKGYGYLRSWIDNNISARTIIKTIRLMYQNRVNDSRELFGGEESDDYAVNFQQFIGDEFEPWMLDDPISINWTSIAQLKRFSGSYIVGGGRNECLREVELLMSVFNIKYKRIDSLVYG